MILLLGFEPACAGVRELGASAMLSVWRRHFKPRRAHFGYNRRTDRPMQILQNRQILRRMRGRIGGRRRHGGEGADRGRRRTSSCSKPGRCGTRRRTRRCSRGPTIRRAAARRFLSGSSASSTPRSAAGRSTASRTRMRPASTLDWFRSRMLGGRTNHWGRISLRFGPDDFRRKSIDGLGDDWPITYDDMKPYYDKVDRFIGIFGIDGEPAERAGRHLPAAAEAALLRAARSRRRARS